MSVHSRRDLWRKAKGLGYRGEEVHGEGTSDDEIGVSVMCAGGHGRAEGAGCGCERGTEVNEGGDETGKAAYMVREYYQVVS